MLDPDFADRSTGPQRQSGKARKTSKAPVAFFARTPSYQCRGKSPGRPQPAATSRRLQVASNGGPDRSGRRPHL